MPTTMPAQPAAPVTVQDVVAALHRNWHRYSGRANAVDRDAQSILDGANRSPLGYALPTLADLGLAWNRQSRDAHQPRPRRPETCAPTAAHPPGECGTVTS